jgi:predicted O-methyltransferase YrrM
LTITTYAEAERLVGDTAGGIAPSRGSELFEFVRRERPDQCLELGFAHGISSVYFAAALEANGAGTLTSVDNLSARDRKPSAAEFLERAGLSHRVTLVFERTSYNWFLHRRVRERTAGGVCEPYLDFCFIDGAHTWVDDGLAFFLVDKLLKPGGWILFDDLSWRMDERWPETPREERDIAQVGEVFDLLVAQHPSYDMIETDGEWGWARKSETPAPSTRTVVRRDLPQQARRLARRLGARLVRR